MDQVEIDPGAIGGDLVLAAPPHPCRKLRRRRRAENVLQVRIVDAPTQASRGATWACRAAPALAATKGRSGISPRGAGSSPKTTKPASAAPAGSRLMRTPKTPAGIRLSASS